MPSRMRPVEGFEQTRLSAVSDNPTLAICPCGMVEYHPVQAKLASSCTTKVIYFELNPNAITVGQLTSKKIVETASKNPVKLLVTGSALPHLDDGSLLYLSTD